MIKLFQFPSDKKIPNLSPFCMKLETYMRICKIPFEIGSTLNTRKAPKGKLPYIVDGNYTLGDSNFIIEYLKDKYGDIADGHLTPKEKATMRALQVLMEDHLYWAVFYSRWLDPKTWPKMKKLVLAKAPALLRPFIAYAIHRKLTRRFADSQFGRHSPDEVYALGCQDIDALADFLGEHEYLMGHTPTSIDAVGYAFIANILYGPFENSLQKHAQQLPKLQAYCDRMQKRFYSA